MAFDPTTAVPVRAPDEVAAPAIPPAAFTFDPATAQPLGQAPPPAAAAAPAPSAQRIPVTFYSLGKDAGGPDELQDKWTNRGYSATGKNLMEGMVAVNPKVHPLGTVFRDPASGEVFIAGDSHGNADPNVVDMFRDPANYRREKQQRALEVIGRVPKVAGTREGFAAQLAKVREDPPADTSKPGELTVSDFASRVGSALADKGISLARGYLDLRGAVAHAIGDERTQAETTQLQPVLDAEREANRRTYRGYQDPTRDATFTSKAIPTAAHIGVDLTMAMANPALGVMAGATGTGDHMADMAREAGQTAEQIEEARSVGQLIGAATMALPAHKVTRLMRGLKVDPWVKRVAGDMVVELKKPDRAKQFLSIGLKALKTGAVTGAASGTSQAAINQAAQEMIDPETPTWQGVPKAAAVGFGVATGVGAVAARAGQYTPEIAARARGIRDDFMQRARTPGESPTDPGSAMARFEARARGAGFDPSTARPVEQLPAVTPSPGASAPQPPAPPAAQSPRPSPATLTPDPPDTSAQGATEPATVTSIVGPDSQFPTYEQPLADLTLSADVPNFKANADTDTGEVEGQALAGKYERLGTGAITVFERLNGRREVISGRHRFAHAKRVGEVTAPAQLVREADGFTVQNAMTLDAEMNIRDGQGSTKDYANYFRTAQIDERAAEERGLLARAKGKAGYQLGRHASDDLFALYSAGKLTEAQALTITRLASGDEGLQRAGTQEALAGATLDDIDNFMQAMSSRLPASGPERAETLDMFGSSDEWLNQARTMAKVATRVRNEVDAQISSAKGAAKNPEKARQLGVDVEDPAAVQAKLTALAGLKERWRKWRGDSELLAITRTKGDAKATDIVRQLTTTPEPPDSAGDEGPVLLAESQVRHGNRLLALRALGAQRQLAPEESLELDTLERAEGQGFFEFAPRADPADVAALQKAQAMAQIITSNSPRSGSSPTAVLIDGVVSGKHLPPQMQSWGKWFGKTTSADSTVRMREDAPVMARAGKGGAYTPVTLAGLPDIKIVQMPELVELAKDLTGTHPQLKKMRRALGMFHGRGAGMIKLDPRIFADPSVAAKVLAHELGHLVDYLPDQTLKRGNLLGRLHTLRSFMQKSLGSGVKDKAIREELIALSQHWKPWDEDGSSYDKYRRSGIELYADAISVLFNSPATIKAIAPRFYSEFFAHLDRKPAVKAEFFQLQSWLHKPAMDRFADRREKMHTMFGKGEEAFERKVAENEERYKGFGGWMSRMKQAWFDSAAPIRSREAAAGGDRALDSAKFLFDESPLADNHVYLWLEGMQREVIAPLEAAGLSQNDLGELLFLNRIANEKYEVSRKVAAQMEVETGGRSVVANPNGITPEVARQQLLGMRLAHQGNKTLLGQWTLLNRAMEDFHRRVLELMRTAHKEGLFTDEQMALIEGNAGNYATFVPLEYVDTFVPSGIYQQVGTLKEIMNPFHGTALKAITLQRAIEYQRTKTKATEVLARFFPGEIQMAETIFMGGRPTPRKPREKGVEQMMVRVKGKPVWYNVPAEIAAMFETQDLALLRSTVEVLDLPFRKVVYPIWITYDPLFQLVRNPIRDFRRSYVNAPAGLGAGKMIAERFRQRGDVMNYVRTGEATPLISEMIANLAITPVEASWQAVRAGSDPFNAMLRKFNLLPEEEPSWFATNFFTKPIHRLGTWIRDVGRMNEILPKAGAYRVMTRDLGWAPRETAYYVRNFIGTPNWMRKGKYIHLMQPIEPFINIWTKGWAADLDLARRGYQRAAGGPDAKGKSAASWWFRWAMTSGIWTVFKAAGTAGVLGAGIKALYDGISEYDKANYDVVPLGTMPGGEFGGKTVFIPVPKDPTDRVLSSAAYLVLSHLFRAANGEPSEGLGASLAKSIDIASDDMPGLNPVLKLGNAWREYIGGHNPIDTFRDQPILSDAEYLVGGKAATERMLLWSYKQTGLQSFVSYDPRHDTTAEFVLGLLPLPRGAIKISDYGHRERQQLGGRIEDARSARVKLSLSADVRQMLTEYNTLSALGRESRNPAQSSRFYELKAWHRGVYKPAEEIIMLREDDKSGTDDLKRALDARSKAFQRR